MRWGRDRGAIVTAAPGIAWLAAFVLVPMAAMAVTGFLTRGELGEVGLPWTLANVRRLAGWDELGFDPLYPRVLVRTVVLGLAVTLACLAAALPMAFFLARLAPRGRAVGLALVIIPFWTNLLVRTYAWQILLGPGGPVSWMGVRLGWDAAALLYPGPGAVFLAAVCDFLPFMVLPVYASVEKIDWSLGEAASDLGASPLRAFRHAIWPQVVPGVLSGCALVFLPCLGQFVIPELLGGGRVTLLGSLVQQQFGPSRDWPFGAAAATVMVVLLAVVVALLGRRPGALERREGVW